MSEIAMRTQSEFWQETDRMIAAHGPIDYIVFPGKSASEVRDDWFDDWVEAECRGIYCEFDAEFAGALVVHCDPNEIM